MRRGTTPTLRLALEDIDPDEIRSLYVTLKQGDMLLTKGKEDCIFSQGIIEITLTQAETLTFEAAYCEVQVRGVKNDDTVFASDIKSIPVDAILMDGEIS